MIFFKLSWLPYMCILFGAIGLFAGGSPVICLLLMAGGIVWVVYIRKNKTRSGEPAQDNSANMINNTAGSTGTQNPGQETEYCPKCGAAVKSGMYFCVKCGYKVR